VRITKNLFSAKLATPMNAVASISLPGRPIMKRGKVRDLFDVGDALLVVATDRISAFDVVLSPGIPDKGKILNQLSNFWFRKFSDVQNHLLETDFEKFPPELVAQQETLAGRSVLVRKCKVIPFECVARGYLAGSGFKDYKRTGKVCGIELPAGLGESQKLPETIFTPATKSEEGHDENVSLQTLIDALGRERALELKDKTISLYERAARACEEQGILLADSKIEFGESDGELVWIDEAFTPDSSRFWPAASYHVGGSPPSYDKQYVRDWLESAGWNKRPPAPTLPEQIAQVTREKYLSAYRKLTGQEPQYI
jgi:phosphoribosylaminoimidazole-succinocarboxamide synthase